MRLHRGARRGSSATITANLTCKYGGGVANTGLRHGRDIDDELWAAHPRRSKGYSDLSRGVTKRLGVQTMMNVGIAL